MSGHPTKPGVEKLLAIAAEVDQYATKLAYHTQQMKIHSTAIDNVKAILDSRKQDLIIQLGIMDCESNHNAGWSERITLLFMQIARELHEARNPAQRVAE